MKTLPLTLVFLLAMSSLADAAPYYRFWRGNIAKNMTHQQFLKGLNGIFIPETVEQGKNDGLISYQPVLPPANKPAFIPDEIALVAYKSEALYDKLRAKPQGSAYQELHWKYFEKGSSRSLVPEKWNGKVAVEKAYDVLQSDADWQKGSSEFLIRIRPEGLSSEKYLKAVNDVMTKAKSLAKALGMLSYVVVVAEQAIYEYVLYDEGVPYGTENALHSDDIPVWMNISIQKTMKPIYYGAGVNRPFEAHSVMEFQ